MFTKLLDELAEFGIPRFASASIDFETGAIYVSFNKGKNNYKYCMVDIGKNNIHLDISDKDSIMGLEDISGEGSNLVSSWLKSLKLAAKRLKLKKEDPEKYFKKFGIKSHRMRNKSDEFISLCGISPIKLVTNQKQWNALERKNRVCLTCARLDCK